MTYAINIKLTAPKALYFSLTVSLLHKGDHEQKESMFLV